MNPIHIPPGEGKKLVFLGIPMSIRIPGQHTNGTISVVELHDNPGGSAPMHMHEREDETFQILEGQYEFTVGEETFIASAGATIFGPRGIPHGYRFLGQMPGRILLIVTPAGVEEWFEEVDALSAEQQQNVPRVIEMGKKYGLEFLPSPGV